MADTIAIDFPHKIVVPQRPDYLVGRARLTDLLGAIRARRLMTLTAPAGYGKTSLLIDFASAAATLPVCWYTLDRFDADPWIFLSYFAASIAQRFPGAIEPTAAALAVRARIPFATAATALIHDIYAVGQDFIMIVDDWHLVDQVADITEVVAQALLHCPNCRLILASRSHPGLPDMMLMAARREMSGLDAQDLRFTAPEITAVLDAEYHTPIPPEQAAALAERSNGWITGVLLAVQATGLAAPSLTPPAMGAERQIYRFLSEQVFERQPEAIRSFLLDSSLLDELTTERCDTLLGRNDSGALLDTLIRHHLFITEVRAGVSRYHPLFREFLHEHYRTLDPPRYRTMARQVAEAYAAQGQWPLAFDVFVAAGDLAGAQHIVESGGPQLLASGRLETLEHWFAALPVEQLSLPLLSLKARTLLDRGHPHEAQALADLAAARSGPDELPAVLLIQSQIARIGGRYEYALGLTEQVLHTTPEAAQRATALRTMAICHHRLNQTSTAIEELREALAIERQRGDLYRMALLQYDLGLCHEATGQLSMAEEYYSLADAYWATIGNSGLRAVSTNSKGVVQHLAGRYREAHATLTTAIQYAESGLVPQYQATALTSLGDLYSDMHLWSRAGAAYAQARQIGGTAYVMSYLELAVIRLLIRQRQYAAADHALQQLPAEGLARHPIMALLLRGAIACGLASYQRAADLAQQALAAAGQGNSLLDQARAALLSAQVVAARAPVDEIALRTLLDRAVQIAEQLGHDAFLVAETLHLPNLLRRASAIGWARADTWRRRQHDILLAAQVVEHQDARAVVAVRALGADQILVDGQPVDLGWLKAREVFHYLLAHPAGASPDALREAIWPDLDPERSRGALKAAIFRLRSELPRDLIALHGRQSYQVNREAVWIDHDVERFLQLVDTSSPADDIETLFEAFDLYRGAYLPESASAWSRELRMYLEQRYLRALRQAATYAEQLGMRPDALAFYQRILAVDPLDEAAHTGVMRCLIALGNRAAAIEQYRLLRRLLDEELGLSLGQASEAERLYVGLLHSS